MTTLNSSTQVVFTFENISTTPAIQVRWVAQPNIEKEYGNQAVQNNSQIPGFKIGWELCGQSEGINNVSQSKYKWMKFNQNSSKEKGLDIMTIMSLVRKSKRQGIHESEVWKTLLKHRWDIDFLKTNSSCLNENQRAEVIYKTTQDLKVNFDWNLWIRVSHFYTFF